MTPSLMNGGYLSPGLGIAGPCMSVMQMYHSTGRWHLGWPEYGQRLP